MIHELCGSGNLDGAIRVYKAMFKGGVSPDMVVHNTMLNRDSQVGRIKECLELWKVMGNDGCCSIVSYNILITNQRVV